MAVALAVSAFPFTAVEAQSPAPLVTLHLAATPDDDVGPVLYAQSAGLFARAGLTVVLDRAPSGTVAISGVLAGSYDIVKSSLVNLMSAHVKGIPLTLIAPAGMYDDATPFAQLLVARDSTIHTAKDLEGKLLAVPGLHDIGQVADSAWVEQHGGDVKSLHFIEFPMSASPAALDEHRFDAVTIVGPAMDAAMATGKYRALGPSFSAIAPHFLFSGWIATQDWVAKHPDVARRFVRVLADASAYGNVHHAEIEPLLAAFTGIPLDVLRKMTRGVYGTVLAPADVQPLIAAAVKYQMIDASFPAQELMTTASSR